MFDFENPTADQLRELKEEHGTLYALSCNNLPDAPKGKNIYFRQMTSFDRTQASKLVDQGEDLVDQMTAEMLVVYPSLVEYAKIGKFYPFLHTKLTQMAMKMAGNVELEEAKKV